MMCLNELMEITISCSDKKTKRALSGAKKNSESFNFAVDLTAFTADKNKPSATTFSQGGTVPSPITGHSLTKISV